MEMEMEIAARGELRGLGCRLGMAVAAVAVAVAAVV